MPEKKKSLDSMLLSRCAERLDRDSFNRISFFYSVKKEIGLDLAKLYLKSKELGDVKFSECFEEYGPRLIEKAGKQLEAIKAADYFSSARRVVDEAQERKDELHELLNGSIGDIERKGEDLEEAYAEAVNIAASLNSKLNKGNAKGRGSFWLLRKVSETNSFADSLSRLLGIGFDNRFITAQHTLALLVMYEIKSEWVNFIIKIRNSLERKEEYAKVATTPAWRYAWLNLELNGIELFSSHARKASMDIEKLSKTSMSELPSKVQEQTESELKEALLAVYRNGGRELAKKLNKQLKYTLKKAVI